MIKVALKHWIYEVCIEQLFSGITKNFNIGNFLRFKKGDHFEYIYFRFSETNTIFKFYDVEITDIMCDGSYPLNFRKCEIIRELEPGDEMIVVEENHYTRTETEGRYEHYITRNGIHYMMDASCVTEYKR